eukprot:SAG11_NODE_24895_length_366_cov_1.209738_1_plen_36_part_01
MRGSSLSRHACSTLSTAVQLYFVVLGTLFLFVSRVF